MMYSTNGTLLELFDDALGHHISVDPTDNELQYLLESCDFDPEGETVAAVTKLVNKAKELKARIDESPLKDTPQPELAAALESEASWHLETSDAYDDEGWYLEDAHPSAQKAHDLIAEFLDNNS